ncbi:MAG: hypothetical protein WAZ34_11220 [Rhodocyclaceae bacterium]
MSLVEEIRKPFNLLNTAIALVSLALSVYFYLEAKQKREPYYLAHQSSQIYSKANSSPKLHLIDKSGKQIDGDVHVLEFSFWNHGRLPIETSDARTPVFVQFPKSTTILDYSIVRENKPDISAFKLEQSVDQVAPRLALKWTHLDPGLGARIQVIYIGEKNPPLLFGGDVLDTEIVDGAPMMERLVGGKVAPFLAALLGIFASESSKQAFRRVPIEIPKWRRRLVKFLVLLLIACPAVLLFWAFFTAKTAPV